MKRFYGYGFLTALLVVGLTAIVAAQPPALGPGMRGQGQGPGQGPGMRGQDMGPKGGPMAALKLTAEQQEQLRALMQTQREAHQAVMQQVQEMRRQLHQTIYSGGDEAAAVALAGEIAAIEARARIHTQMAAAAILTPEQRKIVIDSGMAFPPGPMGPGGRGGPGGPGGRRGGRGWH